MLKKIVGHQVSVQDFPYEGCVTYPGVGEIYDADVWHLIKNHSRFIDRMSTKKMVEMSLLGQCILMGIFANIKPEDPDWTFYGKNSLYSLEDWG